jgi:hypothetical protein
MNRRSLVVIFLGSAIALPIAAQSPTVGPLRVGILAGVNSATLGGKDAEDADRLTGLVAGVYLTMPFAGSLAFRPELLYSQKGAETSFDDEDGSGKAKFKVNYFDIPVLLQYEAGTTDVRPHVYAGPSFGFKASCKVEGSGSGVSVSVDCDDAEADIKSFDLGGIIGAGLTFPLGTMRGAVGARYQHGFSDLADDATVKNRVVSLYVGLEFGKK